MTQPVVPGAGAATRAVLDRYNRTVAAHRRWVLVRRGITVTLVLWSVGGMVLGTAVALAGGQLPWFASVSAIPVLVIWFLAKDRIGSALGVEGEPAFPHRMLEIAAQTDSDAATLRVFGATPASMRVYRPESW